MKISAYHRFRKLWGIIDEDIDEGKYTMEIANSNFLNKFFFIVIFFIFI